MSDRAVPGQIGVKRSFPSQSRLAAAVTLIELLCVICILAILASLLLPAVARAYGRETRNYCAANPQFQFTSKSDFTDKCRLAPKCRDWVEAATTEFIPFDYLTPIDRLVLQVHLGPKQLYSFTRGDLSIRPEDH